MSQITIAASSNAFTQLFNVIRDNFTFSKSDGGNFGPFSANYSVKLHLSGGSVQLNDDNTVEVKNVDVVFDTLTLNLCLNLPGFCVGGYCLIPDPWNGCLVGIPKICIGGPVCIPIDLSGLVSKISDLKANLVAVYFVDPARDPSWSDLDAEFNGHPNKWRIFLNPVFVHVDPIDVPATLENIIENLIKDAIENTIPGPGWLKDLLIGPALDVLESIFGFFNTIIDDITGFISDLLGNQFDLLGAIETAVADYFAAQNPLYEFEDPYPILPASGGLIPVKIPIRDLTSHVNSKEMIVEANVGV
ncbi:MAG TPA: hypothetical protein VN610_03420 [Bryobacteraceae bacterium]|nr:hypothetical protein [Bryobacteraceae bacterium]